MSFKKNGIKRFVLICDQGIFRHILFFIRIDDTLWLCFLFNCFGISKATYKYSVNTSLCCLRNYRWHCWVNILSENVARIRPVIFSVGSWVPSDVCVCIIYYKYACWCYITEFVAAMLIRVCSFLLLMMWVLYGTVGEHIWAPINVVCVHIFIGCELMVLLV